MTRNTLPWFASLFLPIIALLSVGQCNAAENEPIASFLQDHCIKCHGPEKEKGGIRLDQLDIQIQEHRSVSAWQDVLDVLNTGEMPPEDEPRPAKEDLILAIGTITENLTSAHKRLAATGGVISMRHLTGREYLGSMRDLFGDDLPDDLVPAEATDGFDTIGSEQFFSLKQYDNFYKAGRRVVESSLRAYTSPLPEPQSIRHDPEIAPFEAAKVAYEVMVKTKELIEADAPFSEISKVNPKVADEGQARLFITRYPKRSVKPIANYNELKGKEGMPGGFTYTTEARPRSQYRVSVTALESLGGEVGISVNGRDVGSVELKSGQSNDSSQLVFSTGIFDDEISIKVNGRRNDIYDYLTLSGPFADNQGRPAFFESVVKPVVQSEDTTDASVSAMLTEIADRAFRYQGVSDDYITALMQVYRLERSAGSSVADSLIEPITAIITAPAFLYIKEKNDGTRSRLSQREFAIRLSYFLWGSPPDQELYDLAESNQLYDKKVIRAQFERMLASPRADVFLTDFINQWSDIKRFDEIDLPVSMIRNGLAEAARQELSEFFKVLVRENLSLDHLIDSDFAVVDGRLADYYGIKESVQGGFQKVKLPQSSPRGGLLSQAAFLTMGGSGPRTSPTIRGTLIREMFLHDPPPPPPPNVPAIENPKGQKLTVKQLVDQHKDVAQCASCHDKIDPIGYGLENFDYLGKWRTTEVLGGDAAAGKKSKKKGKGKKEAPKPEKVAIEASGHVEGEPFEGFEGLQEMLLKHQDHLARSVYESLLSYGIGRKIEFVDEDDINENLTVLKTQNYPLQEMIFEVITSRTFTTK